MKWLAPRFIEYEASARVKSSLRELRALSKQVAVLPIMESLTTTEPPDLGDATRDAWARRL